jgi:hypothetical protein
MKSLIQHERPTKRTATKMKAEPPFLAALLKLSKPRDWPQDFALNHAHHAKGYAKKA